jgi:hypothetical protein
VVQRGRSLRLTLKAGKSLGVVGYCIRQEFQRDEAVQLHVLGSVDNSHSPATELLDNAVVRDCLANHWREILRTSSGQVNESWGVGGMSQGLLLINPDYTR